MFRKAYSSDRRRAQEKAVNTDEHLSGMSPSEIVEEMENIFLDNNSDDMDVDRLVAYLDHLDQVAPVEVHVDSCQQFLEKHAATFGAHADAKSPRRAKTIMHRAMLAAAVLCVLIGACSIAYAGYTPFAQWEDETSSFSNSPEGEYVLLQDALDAYGVKEKLVPRWLPHGYMISEVQVFEAEMENTFFALYESTESPDDMLTITVRENLLSDAQTVYEKDDTAIDEIIVGSTTYYIGQNNKNITIVWTQGAYECCISGIIEEEDIFKIIDSIV